MRRPHDWRYRATAYAALPVTFVRRVLLGRDPYWRQYFWSRWGYVPRALRRLVRDRRVVWIEALSGGEVTQIVTFCRMLRRALPGWAIVLSTNSKYSFDFARANLDVDAVFDTPWDCRGPVRRALRRIKPVAFVCVQNVYCPLLVRHARRAGVRTVLVSGLMSKDIHRHPMLWRTMELEPYRNFDWIGAWGEDDVAGFVSRGADRAHVSITGNLKFDFEFLGVTDADRQRLLSDLHIHRDAPVFLAASLHSGEEEIVGRAYLEARRAVPGLRLVVVPRYAEQADGMIGVLAGLGLECVKRTEIHGSAADSGVAIIVNTFGELSRLYAVASVVFLGGTMYRRHVLGLGQNPIEPLVQRKVIMFGPFMNLWQEVTTALRAVWPGVEIATTGDLSTGVVRLVTDRQLRASFDQCIDNLLQTQRGSVSRNVDLVLQAVNAGESLPAAGSAAGF